MLERGTLVNEQIATALIYLAHPGLFQIHLKKEYHWDFSDMLSYLAE